MISLKASSDFSKTKKQLEKMRAKKRLKNLSVYGKMGVDALSKATPVDSHLTANSWGYKIVNKGRGIAWYNDNVEDGEQIAILIQYGHGTGTGGYVDGIDYINPAIRSVFLKILTDMKREVK